MTNLEAIYSMRRSPSLKGRIESAAYSLGQTMQWVDRNLYTILSTEGWDAAWAPTLAYNPSVNQDTGVRPEIISDDMITQAVQALVTAQSAGAESEANTISTLQAQVATLQEQVSLLSQVSAPTTSAPMTSTDDPTTTTP